MFLANNYHTKAIFGFDGRVEWSVFKKKPTDKGPTHTHEGARTLKPGPAEHGFRPGEPYMRPLRGDVPAERAPRPAFAEALRHQAIPVRGLRQGFCPEVRLTGGKDRPWLAASIDLIDMICCPSPHTADLQIRQVFAFANLKKKKPRRSLGTPSCVIAPFTAMETRRAALHAAAPRPVYHAPN